MCNPPPPADENESLIKDKLINNDMSHLNLIDIPAFTSTSLININGQPAKRLMVVYRTVGCEYDKKRKGCSMCDFYHYADPNITEKNIQKQHQKTLDKLRIGTFQHFDLLTLGNFFNDREISPSLRKHLLTSLAEIKQLRRVLVESRIGYTNPDKLKQCKEFLRDDQILEYAFGYESSNEAIRNTILNKAVPERHLDDAMKLCKNAGVDFVAYVLIKPHTLPEAEGIKDAVETAVHVLRKAEKYEINARIAFEPVFVTKGKILETLFIQGKYTPPKLWSIIEVLIRVSNIVGGNKINGKLFVGLSDENLSSNRMTSNCGQCDNEIKSAIQDFNGHQDASRLESLYHECKDGWKAIAGV